tara:strand:- start:499 stop:804 length:306 start_codon:yes stop_codon:yes gene_type:complete
MASYNITYPDGSTNRVLADEQFCKAVTADGGSYELVTYPAPSEAEIASFHRDWRNDELAKTDFIVPLSDHPQRSAYMTYRTQLRDWPSTSDFPDTRPTLGS